MVREYIRLPKLNTLPDSSLKKRELTDNFWIELIHSHILLFYKEHDADKLKSLINSERDKSTRKQIEDIIKDYILHWLEKNDKKFFLQGIILNLEPKVRYNQIGFYDMKFQHSDWVNNETSKAKYYPIECKNLDRRKQSLDEYVYNRTKNDGGVFRYFNGKYAQEQHFGGMLGFILEGNPEKIKEGIIAKLKEKFNLVSENGFIEANGIIANSIENNSFTFSSTHSRNGENFTLYHMLLHLN